jgi:hypothetical protein
MIASDGLLIVSSNANAPYKQIFKIGSVQFSINGHFSGLKTHCLGIVR